MERNNLTAAEAVVDSLIEEGVEVVFGMTGDTVLPLLDAMYKRKDEIRYVTARVETGATAMAAPPAAWVAESGDSSEADAADTPALWSSNSVKTVFV